MNARRCTALGAILCVGLTAATALNAADIFEKYTVHMYNADDEERLYINGKWINTQYFNTMGEVGLPDRGGYRDLQLTVYNSGQGWTYGWEIRRHMRDLGGNPYYYTVYKHECGLVGIRGCKENDTQTGLVSKETIRLSFD